ncbi:MAG TPA: 6,7-dimethyl-8-ribityllumazine synthase [Bacteroidales bacterium]|mgnify:CR=1 FL=1|nr:6,7-dimethyl-8-ribityllumazine synthase [Bacteroidales bacterium]
MASSRKNLSDYSKSNIKFQNKESKFTIGIVVSEWNRDITDKLADAAINTLKKYGYSEEDIIKKYVPGSFELVLGAKYLINYAVVDAVICLGCVIQGETRHFDFICSAVSEGIMKLNIDMEIPVSFGVLTTDNIQQAIDRAGGKHGNKGDEAAIAVLKMLHLENSLWEEFGTEFMEDEDYFEDI